MKNQLNRTLALCMLFITVTFTAQSQTSTEMFETESHGSTSFTDNGVIFNILSSTGTFKVQANYPGTGWSGTSADNRYIDNSNSVATGASFSVKTTSNLFKVNRFWAFVSASNLSQAVTGTMTITGRLSGVTKFTQTKTTGFATSLGATNGYTLIDLTNLNGQNYSNIVIDQLQITLGGNYTYLGVDAFTWVKDPGMVLPVSLTSFSASLSTSGLLKADWKTASENNNSHFILQSSEDGKLWKNLVRKDAAVNGAGGATYHVETDLLSATIAGFTLFGFFLIPFSNRRNRILAFASLLLLLAVSCAKEKDQSWIDSNESKISSESPIYLRLAQVDRDGTTTYSETLAVKAK